MRGHCTALPKERPHAPCGSSPVSVFHARDAGERLSCLSMETRRATTGSTRRTCRSPTSIWTNYKRGCSNEPTTPGQRADQSVHAGAPSAHQPRQEDVARRDSVARASPGSVPTQRNMAQTLTVHQPAAAKLEQRDGVCVSNLWSHLEAMEGKLTIVADFLEGTVANANFSRVWKSRASPR